MSHRLYNITENIIKELMMEAEKKLQIKFPQTNLYVLSPDISTDGAIGRAGIFYKGQRPIGEIKIYYRFIYNYTKFILRPVKDKQVILYVFTKVLRFAILHELYHLYKRTIGQEFVEPEEHECNIFALNWFTERKDIIGILVAKYFILSLRLYNETFLLKDLRALRGLKRILKDTELIRRFIVEEPGFLTRYENES